MNYPLLFDVFTEVILILDQYFSIFNHRDYGSHSFSYKLGVLLYFMKTHDAMCWVNPSEQWRTWLYEAVWNHPGPWAHTSTSTWWTLFTLGWNSVRKSTGFKPQGESLPWAGLFHINTLGLNGTLPCVDFMDVVMEDISYCVGMWHFHVLISWMLSWEIHPI